MAPPSPTTSAASGLHDLERDDVAAAHQRADGDAGQVGAEQRHLHRQRDPRRLLAAAATSARIVTPNDHEVGHRGHRPAHEQPVERVAHPQRGHAEQDEERRRGARRRWSGEERDRRGNAPETAIQASVCSRRRHATARMPARPGPAAPGRSARREHPEPGGRLDTSGNATSAARCRGRLPRGAAPARGPVGGTSHTTA